MRKHDARKWLHAVLDLLPVVIIPIFALYATNKNATFAQEITVSQNKVVDFNQLIINGEPSSLEYYNTIDDNSLVFNDNHIELSVGVNGNSNYFVLDYRGFDSLNLSLEDRYLIRFNIISNNELDYLSVNDIIWTNDVNDQFQTRYLDGINSLSFLRFVFHYPSSDNSNEVSFFRFNLFNASQMFGEGNEPTIEQFKTWYPNDYYEFTLSHKELLKDYDQITYNDTDIGSQFMYGLYNSVDKYFNIGNVFNLGSIYDWLNLNIFNGNSPIAIYIVWNIVAYEFLMDLLFLLYGLFMFFIDTCSNLMERFYCNLSGRR